MVFNLIKCSSHHSGTEHWPLFSRQDIPVIVISSSNSCSSSSISSNSISSSSGGGGSSSSSSRIYISGVRKRDSTSSTSISLRFGW